MNKKWLTVLLAAVMVLAMIPATVFAAGADENKTSILVKNADEFLAAVDTVNTGSGDYEISLQENIVIDETVIGHDSGPEFTANTVTIIGNGHTLSTFHGLGSKEKATVNLGKPDGTDTLILKTNYNMNCIAYADEGKLNVYAGVMLRDAISYGTAGGIQLNNAAECHMYGGTIVNCTQGSGGPAGGVSVDSSSKFFMHGGEIKNCSPCGVFVFPDAAFTMTGGKISGCTPGYSNCGAAVCTLSSDNILTGGEISGNSAENGGGIYLQGSATISDDIKIYDNTATVLGDDICFAGVGSLILSDPLSGLILTETGQAIDGWYWDLDSPRWTAENAQKYSPDNPITTEVCLKAAHGVETYTVTYTDGVEGEEIFADQVTNGILAGTATPAFDGTPSRDGYTFKGWSPEVAGTVSGNATYTAQWEKIIIPEEPTDPPKPPEPVDTKPNENIKPPQSGDDSNIALWFVIMLVSGAGLTGTVIYNRKKKSAR